MTQVRVLRIQSRICVGGPALNTILLSAHMDKDRYRTTLVGGRLDDGEKSMMPFAEKKGVDVITIDEMGRSVKALDDLKALWRMFRLIRKVKPHIVHTHTAKAGMIGRLAAFFARTPIRVHTFHGHVFHGYFSKFVTNCFIWLERVLAFLSTKIVTISPAQQRDITQTYKITPKRKSIIIPLGFELDKMVGGTAGRIRAELGLSEDIRLAAIVARLVPIKNHELLLRAIAERNKIKAADAPEVRYLIVGDGEERARLEALSAELGIQDEVVFLGWRSDVPDIFADINLNLLCSKNEGTPVTLIEGLACGVPILTNDVGGIRDFSDESCGRIVPAGVTPADFARDLDAMLSSPQARLPESVRMRIREGFDASRMVRDMENLYADLLTQKGIKP